MPSRPSSRPDGPSAGKRAQLKARTHGDIVQACAALMHDTAGVDFSVDDLAARAGVSRRTVFNHFPSLDDVVAAVGADAFGTVRDALLAVDPPDAALGGASRDPRAALVADLVGALRRADLVGPMASLTHGLGLEGTSHDAAAVPSHQAMLLLKSMSDVSDDLAADLGHRHPGASPLDVDLVVAQFMGGLVVLFRYWFAETDAATHDDARAIWAGLIDHLVPGATARPSEGNHG